MRLLANCLVSAGGITLSIFNLRKSKSRGVTIVSIIFICAFVILLLFTITRAVSIKRTKDIVESWPTE